ncbi:MAG TPA: arginase family protein [Rhodanobacteraceae bacterium]
MPAIVLDLDDSIGAVAEAVRIPCDAHATALRFACSRRALNAFAHELDDKLPVRYGTVFTGSGDFHHLSLPLIARAAARSGPLEVVVFDNHPDNMRFLFGVHCGSWVRRAAFLPGVAHVHVVGITSTDIGAGHAWENYLRPLYAGRVTYWSAGVDTRWAWRVGLKRAFRSFASVDKLLDAFVAQMGSSRRPVYLSIDKDVLSTQAARTNWDQGQMSEAGLVRAIDVLRGRVVASDITGEVSVAQLGVWWKRALSALDHQPPVLPDELARWQSQQHALNLRLLDVIDDASIDA